MPTKEDEIRSERIKNAVGTIIVILILIIVVCLILYFVLGSPSSSNYTTTAAASTTGTVNTNAGTYQLEMIYSTRYYLDGVRDSKGLQGLPGHVWTAIGKDAATGFVLNIGPNGELKHWNPKLDAGTVLYTIEAVADGFNKPNVQKYKKYGFTRIVHLVDAVGKRHPSKTLYIRYKAMGSHEITVNGVKRKLVYGEIDSKFNSNIDAMLATIQ